MNASCILAIFFEIYGYVVLGKDKKPTGMAFEIFETAAKKLNVCYTLKYITQGAVGVPYPNGSYSGLLGTIQRKEANILISPTTTRYQPGLKAFDYSEVVDFEDHTIMLPYPVPKADIAGFLKPYTLEMWILIIVVAAVLILSFTGLFYAESVKAKRNSEKNIHSESFFRACIWTLSSLVAQAIPYSLTSRASAIAVSVWVMMAFILTSVYTSNLITMLTARKSSLPFRTIEEAANQNEVKLAVLNNSYLMTVLMGADQGTLLSKLYGVTIAADLMSTKSRQAYGGQDVSHLPPVFSVKSGLVGSTHLSLSKYGRCLKTLLKDQILPVLMSFTVEKNATFLAGLNMVILRMREAGILEQIKRNSNSNASFCLSIKDVTVSSSLSPLVLTDFLGIFLLFGGGLVLSSFVFLLEVLTEKLSSKAQRRSPAGKHI